MTRPRPVCADHDPRVFFPSPRDRRGIAHAKALCRSCPLVEPCLAGALERHEEGVWGATFDDDRRQLTRRTRR